MGAALVATAVVWPWRASTGRWPVVAYPTGDDPDAVLHCVWVTGRAAANAQAQRWVEETRLHGRPLVGPS